MQPNEMTPLTLAELIVGYLVLGMITSIVIEFFRGRRASHEELDSFDKMLRMMAWPLLIGFGVVAGVVLGLVYLAEMSTDVGERARRVANDLKTRRESEQRRREASRRAGETVEQQAERAIVRGE